MTGPFNSLGSRKVDFIYGHMWVNMGYVEDFDVTYPLFSDNSRWFVPKALPAAQWKSLFVIFKFTLWSAIIIVYLVNSLAWWIIGKLANDMKELQDIGLCFLYSLYALCNGSFDQPKKFVMKFLVISWSIAAFLIAITYQSQLLTILTSPIFEHQISSLHDLTDAAIDVYLTKESIPGLTDMNSKAARWLLKHGVFKSFEELLNSVALYNQKFAFSFTNTWVKFATRTYFTNLDGSPMVYELKDENFLTFFICAYVKKGFPLLKRFDEIGIRLFEFGILSKWIKDTDTAVPYSRNTNGPITLNLNHFMGAFFLLLFGLLVGLTAFIMEIIISRVNFFND